MRPPQDEVRTATGTSAATRAADAEGPDEGGTRSEVDGRAALVAEALRDDPTSFEFFQAVHLMERLWPDRAEVGGFAEPEDEVVKFTVDPSLSFPAAEIQRLEQDEDEPPRVAVNFMGLIGPVGVLPHVYTLLVERTRRDRQNALGDFLDIFQHRIISLFYRAWKKNRFTVAREEGRADPLTVHLLDLVGIGLEELQGRFGVRDRAFAYHAGLLAPVQRSAAALESLVGSYFGVEARVEQFVGEWYALSPGDLCVVGEETQSSRLGLGAAVGDAIWEPHAEARLRLGPMDRDRYESFLPGGSAHPELMALTAFFAHGEIDFEVQLILEEEEIPVCRLGEDVDTTRLAWSTWLPRAPHQGDADDAIIALRNGESKS